jgi:hypothetical protein
LIRMIFFAGKRWSAISLILPNCRQASNIGLKT